MELSTFYKRVHLKQVHSYNDDTNSRKINKILKRVSACAVTNSNSSTTKKNEKFGEPTNIYLFLIL